MTLTSAYQRSLWHLICSVADGIGCGPHSDEVRKVCIGYGCMGMIRGGESIADCVGLMSDRRACRVMSLLALWVYTQSPRETCETCGQFDRECSC